MQLDAAEEINSKVDANPTVQIPFLARENLLFFGIPIEKTSHLRLTPNVAGFLQRHELIRQSNGPGFVIGTFGRQKHI